MLSTCSRDSPCKSSACRCVRRSGFLFLLLVLAFQKRLAGDDPVGGHLFQPGHFAADHVEFLDGAEELRLHLQEVFVGQADLEQRLAGLNGLALDGINPRRPRPSSAR